MKAIARCAVLLLVSVGIVWQWNHVGWFPALLGWLVSGAVYALGLYEGRP